MPSTLSGLPTLLDSKLTNKLVIKADAAYGEAAYMKSKWKKCKGFVLDVIDQVLQESEFCYL